MPLGALLSNQLKRILNERGIAIAEFAEMCDLPLDTVKNVYYGKTTDPKVSTVLQMANALDMTVNCLLGKCSHTPQERTIIHNYRACGKHGKSIIELIAKYEASAIKSDRDSINKHRIPCIVPHGDIHAGIVYDTCETIEIETSIDKAYLAMLINNNALAPVYCKDDIILFENRFPENGEYAGFFKNDRAYIRKFIEEPGQYRLKCLHNKGEDIILKRMDQIEYIGACIGVIRT